MQPDFVRTIAEVSNDTTITTPVTIPRGRLLLLVTQSTDVVPVIAGTVDSYVVREGTFGQDPGWLAFVSASTGTTTPANPASPHGAFVWYSWVQTEIPIGATIIHSGTNADVCAMQLFEFSGFPEPGVGTVGGVRRFIPITHSNGSGAGIGDSPLLAWSPTELDDFPVPPKPQADRVQGFVTPSASGLLLYLFVCWSLTAASRSITNNLDGWTALPYIEGTGSGGAAGYSYGMRLLYRLPTFGTADSPQASYNIDVSFAAVTSFNLGTGILASRVRSAADLLPPAAPFLLRSYRDAHRVFAERASRGADTWTRVTVTSTDAAGDASPTLCANPSDLLWVLYHDSDGDGRIWRSEDFGATWTDIATQADLKFPRAVVRGLRLHVCGMDGTDLWFYTSDDEGVTLTAVGALVSIPSQLVSFRLDRNGKFHLFYVSTGGALVHRSSDDTVDWTAAVNVVASGLTEGTLAAAIGEGQGIACWFDDDDEPVFKVLDETFETVDATGASPDSLSTGASPAILDFESNALGLLIDPNGRYLLCGPTTDDYNPNANDGAMTVAYSDSSATAWTRTT